MHDGVFRKRELGRLDRELASEEIACDAVIVHRDVARLAKRPDAPCVEDQAKILANTLHIPLTTARQKLISLLARHQAEWCRFLDEETSEGSWVRAWRE